MKTVLCIDIGNTTTHIGVVERDESGYHCCFQCNTPTVKHDDQDFETLETILGNIFQDTRWNLMGTAFCSVVPMATDFLKKSLAPAAQSLPAFQLTAENCPGLAINYPRLHEIGQDRLANAIAAQALYGPPAIVIDMGTAVTFDIVTRRGYEGGIIAPGLEVMTRYLHEQTALLPLLDPNDLMVSAGIGKTTRDAMRLGCSVGFSGMIHSLLECVIAELITNKLNEPEVTVVGTGGSTGILPQKWLADIVFIPDLTLFGLAEAFQRNQTMIKPS